MSYPAVIQPDGTVCRSGPNCRRHGLKQGSLAGSILKQIETENKVNSPLHPLFPKGNIVRRGINSPDNTSAIDALDEEADTFSASLSFDEEKAIRRYAMTSYDYLNRFLRKGREGIVEYLKRHNSSRVPTEKEIQDYTGWAESLIPRLDSAFTKQASEPKERLVYKAFRVEGENITTEDVEKYVEKYYPVGKVLHNKAYTSTSADSDYMLVHARKRPQEVVVQEIVTKQGIPLHESDWKDESSASVTDAEREILLPRDIKLKVVGVRKATFESSYPTGRPEGFSLFKSSPKKKRFTVIQMVEVD